MKEFIDFLSDYGNLDQQQIDYVTNKATESVLLKNEHFWEAGKVSQYVGFTIEGVLRVYYYNNKGEDITSYFVEENHLITDWENSDGSFIPVANLQAITDCKLIVFSKQDWKEISSNIASWNNIIQQVITKHKTEKLERRSSLVSEDATERYLSFLQKYPNIINRIPLSYVASYLGIRQQSLSRVRKSIR
jgi:CRP-like cAMP-binding protein